MGLLLWIALCIGQWWLVQQARHAPGIVRPPFVPADLFGWGLLLAAVAWISIWSVFCLERKRWPVTRRPMRCNLEAMIRQRLFRGTPISPRWLKIYGWLGGAGLVLGVGLSLKVVALYVWLGSDLLERDTLFGGRALWVLIVGLPVTSVLVVVLAMGVVSDVILHLNFDNLVGGHSRLFAHAAIRVVKAARRQEREQEREYERKKITGLPYVVFMGGFIGGLFLSGKLLPETEGTMAFQGSISGLIASVAVLYLFRMKPTRGVLWTIVALMVAVGFLVFTCVVWQRPVWYALLGVAWGAGVGVAATLLYLRKLRKHSGRENATSQRANID
jgi:hypothetical protein